MEGMIVGAVNDTITPEKGPVTMAAKNLSMTMAVTEADKLMGSYPVVP